MYNYNIINMYIVHVYIGTYSGRILVIPESPHENIEPEKIPQVLKTWG